MLKRQIHHFFEIYKDLEPGKSTDTRGWSAKAAALAEIEEPRRRYHDSPRTR